MLCYSLIILPAIADDSASKCEDNLDFSREYLAPSQENAMALYDCCVCLEGKNNLSETRACYLKVIGLCGDIFNAGRPSDPVACSIESNATARMNALRAIDYQLPSRSTCTCRKDDDYRSIIADYENLTRKYPNDARAWNNLGVLLAEHCCTKEAEECFKKVLSINSSLPDGWYNRGVILFYDDPKEALRCFNRSLGLNSSLAEALFNKCALLLPSEIDMLSNTSTPAYKEAVVSYSMAIELSPDLGLYKPPYLVYRWIV